MKTAIDIRKFTNAVAIRLGAEGIEQDEEILQLSERTLPEIARECFRAEKRPVPRIDYELVRASFAFGGTLFAAALSNAISKTVSDTYLNIIPNWSRIFNRAEVSRLSSERIEIDAIGRPPEIPPGGEYRGSDGAGDIYSWVLKKYGRKLMVTFEAVLNDDIDLIRRWINEHVAACLRLEDDLAFELLVANPTMNDNKAYFYADHNNLLTGSELTADNFGSAIAKLRAQTTKDGVKLHLKPAELLVPGALEKAARAIVAAHYFENDADRVEVVVEGRLDSNSTTTWYLTADMKQIDSFIVGFLKGQAEPQVIPLRRKLEVDGARYNIRHIIGCKGVNFSGGLKCTT